MRADEVAKHNYDEWMRVAQDYVKVRSHARGLEKENAELKGELEHYKALYATSLRERQQKQRRIRILEDRINNSVVNYSELRDCKECESITGTTPGFWPQTLTDPK